MVKDKKDLTEVPMSKQSSQSSIASNDSILSTGSLGKGFEITDTKRSIFGKTSKYKFGSKKKNKITKHDFFNKTAEFRMWLTEEKAFNLDELSETKAKELFKKFVKKWNKRSLSQKYYVGTDPLWSVASPSSYSRVGVPSDDDTLVEPSGNTPDVSPTPSGFSTFGKRTGLKMLRKLQDKPMKEQHSPKEVPENLYDELIFGKASFQRPKSGFASPSKAVALSQNQDTTVFGYKQGESPICTPVANPKPPGIAVNHYSEPYSPPLPSPPPPEELIIPGPTFIAPPPPPPPEVASANTSPIYAQPLIKRRNSPNSTNRASRSKGQEYVGRDDKCLDSPTLRMPPPPPPPPRSRSMQFDHGTFALPNDRPLTRSRSRESISSISSVVSEPAYNMGGRIGRNSSRRRPPVPPKRTDSLRSVNSDTPYRMGGSSMMSSSQSLRGTVTRSRSRESLASVTSDLGSSLSFSDKQSVRYGSQRSMQSAMSVSSQNSHASQTIPDAGSPAKLPKKGAPRKGVAPPPPPFALSRDIPGYASIKKKRPSIHLAKSLQDISTKVLSSSNSMASKEDIKKFKKDGRFDTSSSWTKPILV